MAHMKLTRKLLAEWHFELGISIADEFEFQLCEMGFYSWNNCRDAHCVALGRDY